MTTPYQRIACLALLLLTACYNVREQSVMTITGKTHAIPQLPDAALISNADVNCPASLKAFYAARDFSLFWQDSSGLTPQADSLIQVIRQANLLGLQPGDYHYDEIQKLLTDSLLSAVPMADLLLTDSYLALYRHIRQGRLNPQTLQRIDLSSTVDEDAILSLRDIDNVSLTSDLRMQEPKALQFHELKAALRSFVQAANQDSVQRERAARIALNMERWRWQQPWPDRYIVVNIPAFQLRAVENDSVWLRSKVIVGKRDTPTPVMESVIRSFIIYPYWHVPASISTSEFLPELQADRAYLEKHNFDVLTKAGKVIGSDTIQWEIYSADYFPFILRQREGSENSMGIIKFNFANPYGVYLHDTNSKRLFKRNRRDLSHGCVRVSDAVALAHYLVREDDIYVSPEDLDQYLSLQQRLEIKLRKPIALKLEYFTCEVESGTPHFYDDIYKKDSVMMRVLASPMFRETHDTEKASF